MLLLQTAEKERESTLQQQRQCHHHTAAGSASQQHNKSAGSCNGSPACHGIKAGNTFKGSSSLSTHIPTKYGPMHGVRFSQQQLM